MNKLLRKWMVYLLLVTLTIVVADLILGSLFLPSDLKLIGKYYRLHPYYGHGLHAMRNGEMYYGNHKYHLSTNSMGMKDRSPRVVDTSSNKTRILLIGDSFTEGAGFTYDSTVAGFLTGNFDSSKVEVLNAGVGSYSTKLYRLKIQYLLEKEHLKFDEIILLLDNSDLTDDLVYNKFQPKDQEDFQSSRFHAFYRYHSIIYNVVFFIRWMKFCESSGVNPGLIHYFMYKGDAAFMREKGSNLMDFHRKWYTNAKDPWVINGLDIMTTELSQLIDLCKARNIKYTMVLYPWPHQLELDAQETWQRKFWLDFCTEKDVKLVDLFPSFQQFPPDSVRSRYFMPYDDHWSAAGHQFVANCIFGELNYVCN